MSLAETEAEEALFTDEHLRALEPTSRDDKIDRQLSYMKEQGMGHDKYILIDLDNGGKQITAAEDEKYTPKRAESGLQGWIDCFEKAALRGHVFCGGVNNPHEIDGNAKLQGAFELGKSI